MATFVYRHIHTNQMVYVPTLEFAGNPDWELISGGGGGGDATVVQADLNIHKGSSTSVHGIDNTADLATKTYADGKAQDAANASVPLLQKGAANGVASLDSGGKVPAAQVPAISLTDYLGPVASQAAMLALVPGQLGDWTIRTDLSTTWVISGVDPTQLSSWTELGYPNAVTSVAGKTGIVTLAGEDISLGTVAYARLPVGDLINTVAAGDDIRITGAASATALTNGLATKVGKGELVVNAKDHGAIGDGSANDTAALQAALNAAIAAKRKLYIPAGNYRFSSLAATSDVWIVGDHIDFKGVAEFGNSIYSDLTKASGTWLVCTATSGIGISFDAPGAGYMTAYMQNIGLIGPGTGTTTGISLASRTMRSRLDNVRILNCATGLSVVDSYDSSFNNVGAWGCKTGFLLNGANQSVFTNSDVQLNSDFGIRFTNTNVCSMLGGVTEVNSGTPISIEGASSEIVFENWYFEDIQGSWPAPVVNHIDINDGCDYNAFTNCHFGGSPHLNVAGNHNQIINPQGVPSITLADSSANVLLGTFNGTITETLVGENVILDAVSGRFAVPGHLFIKAGKKFYLNASAASTNWIGRNSSTGDTEISTATLGVKLLSTGPNSAWLMVGTGSPEAAVAATVGSVFLRTDGATGTAMYIKETGAAGNTGWVASAVGSKVGKGDEVLNVKDYGALGDGSHDDTPNIQAAIDAAVGGTPAGAASNGNRSAIKPVYIPRGFYKITAPLKIYGVIGFKMFGDGFNTALYVSGTTMPYAVDCVGIRHALFENFRIQGFTSADIVTTAFGVNNVPATSINASCYSVTVRKVSVVQPLTFVNGFGFGESSGSLDLSSVTAIDCVSTGIAPNAEDPTYWQAGYVSGGGVHGNPLDHYYYGCKSIGHKYGFFANACNMTIVGCEPGHNLVDFHQFGNRRMHVTGVRSEHSRRLFDQGGGATFGSYASLNDILFETNELDPDNRAILAQYGGNLNLSNVTLGFVHALAPVIYLNSLRPTSITINGITTRTAIASLFEQAGASQASVVINNYSQCDSGGLVIDRVPLWTKNFGTFTTSQKPTLVDGLVIGSSADITPTAAGALAAGAADAVTVGQIVPSRDRFTSNGVAPSSGTMALTYFTADKTESINTLTAWTGTQAAAATPTLCRMGVYAVAANGDLTLVASTANDTTLFAAQNTAYAKALSATFSKVAGQRYAAAVLVVSGTTMPVFHGQQLAATAILNVLVRVAPAIVGRVTGQTDLPASVVAASAVGFQGVVGMQLS